EKRRIDASDLARPRVRRVRVGLRANQTSPGNGRTESHQTCRRHYRFARDLAEGCELIRVRWIDQNNARHLSTIQHCEYRDIWSAERVADHHPRSRLAGSSERGMQVMCERTTVERTACWIAPHDTGATVRANARRRGDGVVNGSP